MSDELISVIDLADQYGKRKQTIFKVLRRLGIETEKLRSANNRGQVISYITNDESRLVINDLQSEGLEQGISSSFPDALLAEQGVFYLLVLEPDHDSGRASRSASRQTSLSDSARYAALRRSCKSCAHGHASAFGIRLQLNPSPTVVSGCTRKSFARHHLKRYSSNATGSLS